MLFLLGTLPLTSFTGTSKGLRPSTSSFLMRCTVAKLLLYEVASSSLTSLMVDFCISFPFSFPLESATKLSAHVLRSTFTLSQPGIVTSFCGAVGNGNRPRDNGTSDSGLVLPLKSLGMFKRQLLNQLLIVIWSI